MSCRYYKFVEETDGRLYFKSEEVDEYTSVLDRVKKSPYLPFVLVHRLFCRISTDSSKAKQTTQTKRREIQNRTDDFMLLQTTTMTRKIRTL